MSRIVRFQAGHLWGWFLFVGIPVLSFFYGITILLDNLREVERLEFSRSAAEQSNRIFVEADEIEFVRHRFLVRKANLHSQPSSGQRGQRELFISSHLPANDFPLIKILAERLGDRQEPGSEMRKHWERELGFYFSLELAKRNMGKPLPIKWQGENAYLVWSAEKTPKEIPRIDLFICCPPPRSAMLKRAFSRRSEGRSGGVVDLNNGHRFLSRGLDASAIRKLIEQCRFNQDMILSQGDHWHYWERGSDGFALFFSQPQFWGDSRQNHWKAFFAISLPLLGTWLFRLILIRWEMVPIRGKISGIVLVFTIFPLLFGSILLVKVNSRLQPAATEEWLHRARHELRFFDQQFLEQIYHLQGHYAGISTFSRMNHDLEQVIKRFSEQIDQGWIDTYRLYSNRSELLVEKSRFGSDQGFEQLEQYFADRQIEKVIPRPAQAVRNPNYLFLESALDESILDLRPDRITRYRSGQNLLYSFFTVLESVPMSQVAYSSMSITHEGLVEKYLQKYLLRHRSVRVVVREKQSGTIFPTVQKSHSLSRFFQGIQRSNGERIGRVRLGGNVYAAIGIPGKNLEGFDLAALIPQRLLEANIERLRRNGVLLLLLTLGVSTCAALHLFIFLWMPIRWVGDGLEAVSRGDFSVSIPVSGQHELGLMAVTFNHFIETLGELNQAKTVQSTLIPTELPKYSGYEIAAHCVMCGDIGGDYLDVIPLPDGRLVCLIGDVSGHGTSAALIMAIAKTRVFLHFDDGQLPEQLFLRLNESLKNLALKSQMMSMVVAILDNRTHQAEIWNAGHPYPISFSAANRQTEFLGRPAFPLGKVKKIAYQPQFSVMNRGDLLVMYSDGLVEALNREGVPFSYQAFTEFIAACQADSAQELLDRILEKWHAHLDGIPPEDDLSLMVIRRGDDADC